MRRLTALVAAVVGLLVLAGVGWTWAAASGQSEEDELLAVVDQFQAPQGWEVLIDDLEPARFICLGGNACPSVRKDWAVPEALTPQDMEALIEQAGWDLTVEGDCQVRQNVGGFGPVCSATGTVDGVYLYLVHNRDRDDPDNITVQLFADPTN